MAALSSSPFPAGRGTFRGIPFWPQCRTALPVGGSRRGARRFSLGDLLGRVFFLPGQLRRLRDYLRKPRRRRGVALLPVSLRVGGVVRRGAERGDLPAGYGQ